MTSGDFGLPPLRRMLCGGGTSRQSSYPQTQSRPIYWSGTFLRLTRRNLTLILFIFSTPLGAETIRTRLVCFCVFLRNAGWSRLPLLNLRQNGKERVGKSCTFLFTWLLGDWQGDAIPQGS